MTKALKYKWAIVLFSIGSLLAVNLIFFKKDFAFEDKVKQAKQSEANKIYGFDTDSFNVHTGVVKPNEFLANILLKFNLSYPQIQQLVDQSEDIFDVRNIIAGKNYAVLEDKDTTNTAKYFVYEKNAVEYFVFDLDSNYKVVKKEREVVKKEREITGVITTSLYESLIKNNARPEIASVLANIYSCTLDFYRIQKGDAYTLIFEEKFVEGKSIGIGDVKCSKFTHNKEDFYAFKFTQNGVTDYYDESGLSLRKSFLQAPLKYTRISSRFSRRRYHPVQKRYKSHLGTDYAAPKGTPIVAVSDGEIIAATYKKYNGKYVKIKHNSTYTTQYLHMSKIGSGIIPGKMVKQGEVIGYVGSTGLATGPHVCFRFWKNGEQVDPYKEKFAASKPISVENKLAFNRIIKQRKLDLDQLSENGYLAHKKGQGEENKQAF